MNDCKHEKPATLNLTEQVESKNIAQHIYCVDCGLSLSEILWHDRATIANMERQLQIAAMDMADKVVTNSPQDFMYATSDFDNMWRDCCQLVQTMKKVAEQDARNRWKLKANEEEE